MLIYLTSSFLPFQEREEYRRLPGLNQFGFMDELKSVWPKAAKLLVIAADPDDAEATDFHVRELKDVLELGGFDLKELYIADHRNEKPMGERIAWADVIYLAGGHAPSQLRFLREIGFANALASFDGILIGLSAGSVNMADEVYLMPEFAEEAVDPGFVRFQKGLGLTALNIVPHRDYMKSLVIHGLRMVEDILLPDSYGHRFYMISDGSYFRIIDGMTEFFGEGEILSDGQMDPLLPGVLLPVSSAIGAGAWQAVARDGFECVFRIDTKTKK